jgi:iron(III) transport system permease protein
MRRIDPQWVNTAQGLGVHGFVLWHRVYWPLLRGGLLGAFLLAFARIAQDLPVALLLRPPDWDTLAVRVFDLARAGQWQQASLPGLTLVVVGLPQIFVLARGMGNNRYGRA